MPDTNVEIDGGEGVPVLTLMLGAWGGGEYDRDRFFTVPYLAKILRGYVSRHSGVPNDPHGYITTGEAPTYGELVVHVESGARQGGQYEPVTKCMSGNIALEISGTK
jgi:hypothetical protein